MIESICNSLTKKIQKKMPEVDEERAEVINYGLQLLFGEVPKFFIELFIAWICGVLELSIFTLLVMMPYKMVSGGVHLRTHIGCIIATTFFYTGVAVVSKYFIFESITIKYIVTACIWILSIIMIKLYAPADTAEVPILRKNERKIKKILSYIFVTATLLIGVLLKNAVYSNILIFGCFVQTLLISKVIYTITKCKYGFLDEYKNSSET